MIGSIFMALRAIYFYSIILRDPVVCDIYSNDSHWSLLAWLVLAAGSRPGGAGTMVAMVCDCSWLSTSASYWSPSPLHTSGQ